MIGSLLYLTASRPDIMFSVCLCARFQADPKESHMTAVKRIFRYLLGTQGLGIWYPRHSTSFEIIGFSDSDFAGCKVDRKILQELINSLDNLWSLGLVGSKTLLHIPLLKLSTSLLEVVWPKSFG
ncbi:putative mitochondrial protein [Dendrobium catenatum]|uniref:Putative mitochondrial protein n=1 Tax=Dendrobium catenatum TaxID=906689 RepID=A0A2I0WSK0_9ASPA|nr:putative mitochondrial protein [Dendrobium catenatum]